MGKINIGTFTDKIVFLKTINSKGELAQLRKNYVPVATVFADVQVQPTSEQIVDSNLVALEKVHVVAYALQGINTNCIIRWNGSDYNVSGIVYDKTKPFMELDAIKMLIDASN